MLLKWHLIHIYDRYSTFLEGALCTTAPLIRLPPCRDTNNPSYSRRWAAVLAHWAAAVSSPPGAHKPADVGTRLIRSTFCLISSPNVAVSLSCRIIPEIPAMCSRLERSSWAGLLAPSAGLRSAPAGCSAAMPPGVVTAPPSSSAGCFGPLMRPHFTDNSVISQGEIYQM